MLSIQDRKKLNSATKLVARLQRKAGLPDYMNGAVAMSAIELQLLKLDGLKIPKERRGLSALDFALQFEGRTCLAVMAGTNFEAKTELGVWTPWGKFYYELNECLALRFAKIINPDPKKGKGAVILSGGSYGLGMWGLLHCYRKVLKKLARKSQGFVSSVFSSLADERTNPDVDRRHSAEMQRSILARELLLLLSAVDLVLVYPGSDGTFSERAFARLLNYVVGRGLTADGKPLAIEAPRRAIAVVDFPLGNGKYFFEELDILQHERVKEFGMLKPNAKVTIEYFRGEDPGKVADQIISFLLHQMVSAGRLRHEDAFPHEVE